MSPGADHDTEADAPAAWAGELAPQSHGTGWYEKRGDYSMVHHERSASTLVVAFDNIGPAKNAALSREPWAWKFVRDEGHSYLGVMSRAKVWYRDAPFIDWMTSLAASGLFARHERVMMCGTSQGGFAALAFASLAPGCRVLALNPQSTLDPAKAPWESRWRRGREADWSLPFSDAGEGAAAASRAYVVYDPFMEGDRRHAMRVTGRAVMHLKLPFAGHFTPVFLRRLDLLKTVMARALDGTLTADGWRAMTRERKRLPWYANALRERAEEAGHERLAASVMPTFGARRAAEAARASKDAARISSAAAAPAGRRG